MKKITIVLYFHVDKKKIDVSVPDNISANELVIGLNEAYKLEIDTEDLSKCFLRAENPIALLKGNKKLSEYGLRNGSIIHIFK